MALPIDWEAIQWLWSLDGYPSDPAHAQFAGKSLRGRADLEGRRRGLRPRRGGGGGARARPASSSPRPPPACASSPPRATAAACSSSRSTPSCSATGGRRGRSGCARSWPAPRRRGCACSPCPRRSPSTSRSSARSPPRPGARTRTCSTWDSPAVADLAWGARRLELRLLRALRGGLRGDGARARRARAAGGAGERLGLPRQTRPGGRLRLPAGDFPRRSGPGGHRLSGHRRPAHARPRP